MTEHQDAAKNVAAKGQSVKARHCDRCGTVIPPGNAAQEHWGYIWFCEVCTGTLTADEAAALAQELALRGVPYS